MKVNLRPLYSLKFQLFRKRHCNFSDEKSHIYSYSTVTVDAVYAAFLILQFITAAAPSHIMSDYFDEMGWQPVDADRIQDHQTLLVARFLSDNGFFAEGFDADTLAPPAAKHVVANLAEKKCTVADEKCAICLKPNTAESVQVDVFKVLQCSHAFHDSCILPWLEKVSINFTQIF